MKNANALNLFQFGRSNDDDEDDDEENAAAGDVLSFDANPLSRLESFTVTRNPWDTNDDFDVFKSASSSMTWAPEGGTSDNFADFDAHFSSFTNDMGESLTTATSGNDNIGDFNTPRPQENVSSMFPNASNTSTAAAAAATTCEEYDNNANVGKLSWPGELSAFHSRQNFVDDYEDDDGMWTKPLGASAFNATENSQEAEKTNNIETDDVVQSAFTNGPTTKCAEGDNKV